MSRDSPLYPNLVAAYAALADPNADSMHVAIARALMCGYHHHWHADTWQVEAVEQEFLLPIVNPATRRSSPLFRHAGKFDGLIARRDERYLLEHKTCSEDVSPGGWYWKRLAIDTQISGYMLASWLQGRKLAGVLYDVIRKPEIRPKKVNLKDAFVVRSTGTYFDRQLSPAAFQAFSLDDEARETDEMFEARLAADTLARPDWYFGRRVINRLDREILAYAQELWQTAKEVRRAEKEHDCRRNDKACFAYRRPCEFLDLCSGHARPDSGQWLKLPTLHPELEDLPNDGSHVLTHSRLSVFNTCRRKHHYRYELGLAPRTQPEPLTFGSLLHRALAAWWQTPSHQSVSHTATPHYRHHAQSAPTKPRAAARRPGLGQDQPGGSSAEAVVPDEQE